VDVVEGRWPLFLVFQVREGLVGGLEETPPLQVVADEGEVKLQQVVKFNMMCHMIFSASKVKIL